MYVTVCMYVNVCEGAEERTPYVMAGGLDHVNKHVGCPQCGAFERHRMAALVEHQVPQLFPRWQTNAYLKTVANVNATPPTTRAQLRV